MQKKGALVASEIVIWTLVVLGFALVIYFLASLGLNEKTDDELCRLSILTRATAPTEAQGIVPLNCYTKKICLTMDKSKKCEEQFAGEKVDVVKLPEVKYVRENGILKRDGNGNALLEGKIDEAKELIAKTTVEAFYSCWDISGKGRFDLFGSYLESRGLNPNQATCILCSRLAIDKSVPIQLVNSVDVHEYLRKPMPRRDGLSYLQVLTDGKFNTYAGIDRMNSYEKLLNTKKFEGEVEVEGKAYKDLSLESKDPKVKVGDYSIKIPSEKIDGVDINVNRELVMVFSQIKSVTYGDAFTNLGKDALYVGAAGAFFIPGSLTAARLVLGGIGFKIVAVAGAAVTAVVSSAVLYNVYQGKQMATGYCGDFTTNTDEAKWKKGCSLIHAVPYDVEAINKMCPQIEGWP